MAVETGLNGRICLITGASSGIGAHLVRVLAHAGAKVVAGARRKDRLTELCEAVRVEGGEAEAVELDVCSADAIGAAFDFAQKRFGLVDTVVANAGINIPHKSATVSVGDFDRIVSVNLRGVFLTAREGARRMLDHPPAERRGGRILLVSSIGGLKLIPGHTTYSLTKSAVAMMGEGLAYEWAGASINVNVICPGYIETEMTEGLFQREAGHSLIKSFPRKRLMRAEQLDPLVTLLLSDASEAITGGIFAADEAQHLA